MKKRYCILMLLAAIGAGWLAVSRNPHGVLPTGVASSSGNLAAANNQLGTMHEESPAKGPALLPTVEPGPISLIDGANPVNAWALDLLSSRYLRYLEKEPLGQNLSVEQLMVLARKLAVVRLSLSMHEATIAEVRPKGNGVEILIPAYQWEGEQVQKFIFDQLLSGLADGDFKRQMDNQFGYFGRYAQRIEVQTGSVTSDGKSMPVYTIQHHTEITGVFGPLMAGSLLPGDYLGAYTPFAGFFPKAPP